MIGSAATAPAEHRGAAIPDTDHSATAAGFLAQRRARAPHILQITPTSYTRAGIIGGGERIALYIDDALRRAACESGVALDTAVLALDGAASAGGPGERFQTLPGEAWNPRSLDATLLSERIRPADIVYVHQCLTEIGLFVAAHACLLGKRVYGSDAGQREAGFLAANPDALRVYDAVHALSRFAASAFQGLPVRVHVVPGPVDTTLHQPPPDGAPPRDPRLVVSVGRVLPHKGHERAIRALPEGMSLIIAGQHYDACYLGFLRRCAEARDVRFRDDLDDAGIRALLHRAGSFVQASTHFDYRHHFHPKPELLGLAPLEALASGAPTLVSDAACLPELARLPGCRVFRSEAELSAMLRAILHGESPLAAPAAMHAAVDACYGPATVGRALLEMMEVDPRCGS